MLRRRRSLRAGGTFVVAVAAMAGAWPGDAQTRVALDAATFRADSRLVLVPVTVVDRRGAIVSGLTSDAFTLTEDGAPQDIRSLSEEDAPVSMGIVLDLSNSMKKALGTAKQSLATLMKDANPGDEAFLNGVSTRPRAYSGFTKDLGEILDRVAFENAGGDTALVDTIYDSLRQLRSGVYPRKALLVISDGMDNHSRHSRGELLDLAMETDAQVYTVAAGEAAPAYSKPIELAEEKRGLLFLDELAAKTGGMSFIVRDQSDIAGAAASVGRALRNQYTIGYAPRGDGGAGKWRKIRVKVAGAGMRAYARTGYRLD